MNSSEVYLSVVIPVYNSSNCLPELIKQLIEVLNQVAQPYEIVLVEDCSPDNSWKVVKWKFRTKPATKGASKYHDRTK